MARGLEKLLHPHCVHLQIFAINAVDLQIMKWRKRGDRKEQKEMQNEETEREEKEAKYCKEMIRSSSMRLLGPRTPISKSICPTFKILHGIAEHNCCSTNSRINHQAA